VSKAAQLYRETADLLGSGAEARWMLDAAMPHLGIAGQEVPDDVAQELRRMVARRRAGEPLQYVLGTWAFRTLELRVDRRVLIPRPETEQVVSCALEELRSAALRPGPTRTRTRTLHAVDLGTGSGAIALSLAAEAGLDGSPPLEVWATDDSADALAVAGDNLSLLACTDPQSAGRVRLAQGSWFDALHPGLAGNLDLVVSNPPYVSAAEWQVLDPVVRDHEPREALVAGDTGREALETIVSLAPHWLAPHGSLVVELAPHQAEAVAGLAASCGFAGVEVRSDLAGRPRALVARRSRE